MNKRENKIVIYTAISGNYDRLIRHNYKSPLFDYVCFADSKISNPGIWEIRPFVRHDLDNVRLARYHKIMTHKILDEYDYSVWIDGNIDVLSNVLEKKILSLIKKNSKLSMNIHFERNCTYDEAKKCIISGKDSCSIITNQIKFLKSSNFPENYGLPETNIIFRDHKDYQVIKTMEDWWNLILKYSYRDQLSIMFSLYKNNFRYSQMFLVNSRFMRDFRFEDHKICGTAILKVDPEEYGSRIVKNISFYQSDIFEINFNLESCKNIGSFCFVPFDKELVKIKLSSITYQDLSGIEHNFDLKTLVSYGASDDSGNMFFNNTKPEIYFKLGLETKSIVISGEITIIDKCSKIYSSYTWKIGKIILWLPSKILFLFRVIKQIFSYMKNY
ncbi:MAG: DUF616 domain-containing protein [Candidatus Delongbacteria bacterium]|nr:DUF616 domain-containing protein [Candidatus Delongbacteria bacterium]